VVGALVAGILLGPSVLGLVKPDPAIAVLAELGVIILLFTAGMETDFKQLKRSIKSTIVISIFGVVLALGGGFAATIITGRSTFESFFVGVVIASMSTSITVEALSEMGKLKTKSGTAILGASVIDDVLGIVILAVMMGSFDGGFSLANAGITLVKIILFFIFAIMSGYAANKLLSLINKKSGASKRLSIFALAFCFSMAFLAELFGLADITGAYIAGIAFCNTRFTEYIEEKTHVLSYMLLSPIFFASIGIGMSLTGFDSKMLLFTGLLLVAAIITKVVGCGLGARICKYSSKESMQIGVGMIARGEVSIIIATKGIAAGLMSNDLFTGIIIVVIITVLVTPILLKIAYKDKVGADNPVLPKTPK